MLKLPRVGNDGSRRGSVVHDFLELMSRPDRRWLVDTIVKEEDVFAFDLTERYLKLRAVKEGVGDKENMELIKDFALTGLSSDFYGEGEGVKPDEDYAEYEFEYEKDDPDSGIRYRILGFLDRVFVYKKKKKVLIRDYKTSKKKFEGEDTHNNLQNLIYNLAINKMFCKYKKRVMEFLFLKFDHKADEGDDSHCLLKMDNVCEDELSGLEYELTHYQDVIDNFDEDTAVSNFAADQGFPSDGSFCGRLSCGFAKYKGQLKKDGSPMWHCEYKFPFSFYRIYNEKDEEVACIKEDEFRLEKLHNNHYYKKYDYAGCPKFN